MNAIVPAIPAHGLMLAFVPAVIVIGILYRWRANAKHAAIATLRMLIQLLLVGYILIYIFESEMPAVTLSVLAVMLCAASWIAIGPLIGKGLRAYRDALIAITFGGLPILVLVTQAVINVDPWFSARHIIPLAGMIFAGSMNAVSLAAERFEAETNRGVQHEEARRIALGAALIPITNSLLAVGLVSLPGLMTGQILAGVSPLIAAKYQIVVMAMLFGATGLSAALYLVLSMHAREPGSIVR